MGRPSGGRYREVRATPVLQKLFAATQHYAIWDDHDYGSNNVNKDFALKQDSLKHFRDYWPNPDMGLPDLPGTQFLSENRNGVQSDWENPRLDKECAVETHNYGTLEFSRKGSERKLTARCFDADGGLLWTRLLATAAARRRDGAAGRAGGGSHAGSPQGTAGRCRPSRPCAASPRCASIVGARSMSEA